MTGAPRRVSIMVGSVTLAVLAALALAIFAAHSTSPGSESRAPPRPTLLLLTSLPLVFGEGFSLSASGSPAYTALQAHYRVVPISVTNARDLAKGRLLLMAQPFSQTADNLVTLDAWVRAGGQVLLLADPMLEWPSKRPLGDRTRPPPMFADTGLLAHWGLRLDAPEQRGPVTRMLGGTSISAVSPGELAGSCAISADRLVARCAVGRGVAVIVADADFLNVAAIGNSGENNLAALDRKLASM